MGDILERLDTGEEHVVFAHEMSHLVNRDIWPMLLLRVGSGGIAWQKWGLLIAMITMSYEWAVQVARTLQLTFPREFIFLLVAWLITTVVHAVYKLGEMAHSRGREYLADAGAVALTGWENRAQLVTALLKIGHGQSGRSPFKLLRKTGLRNLHAPPRHRRPRRSVAGAGTAYSGGGPRSKAQRCVARAKNPQSGRDDRFMDTLRSTADHRRKYRPAYS